MNVKTAIVLDNIGTWGNTPEEERDEILKELRDDGVDATLVHYGNDPLDIPETQIDCLIVDYGALWQNGMQDWTKGLLTWAEDHPGSLVLIWSSMTADMFVNELRDTTPDDNVTSDADWTPPWPANMRAMQMGNTYYAKWVEEGQDGVDYLIASREFMQAWFGVEKGAIPLDKEIEAAGPLVAPDDFEDEAPEPEVAHTPLRPIKRLTEHLAEVGIVVEAARPGVICHQCGQEKPYESWDSRGRWNHMHCTMCGDLYQDFKEHEKEPGVKRRHEIDHVVYEAVDDDRHGWVRRIYDVVVKDPKADLSALGAEIGSEIAAAVTARLAEYEYEEAVQVLVDREPDLTVLSEHLVALKEWLDADRPLTSGAGWDHFGFGSKRPVLPRPMGTIRIQCHPGAGRTWVRLAQDETRYSRALKHRQAAPISEVETLAFRRAFADAGFTITKEWPADSGISYEVEPFAGPNIVEADRRSPSKLQASDLPRGWS